MTPNYDRAATAAAEILIKHGSIPPFDTHSITREFVRAVNELKIIC